MLRLLLLFIGLPALELALLIQIGRQIGTLPTLALIVLTGALGATLARSQGLRVLGEVRRELDAGRLPAGPVLDGLIILLAAAVLVTPGILTDAFGFLCLVPRVRAWIKREILRRLEGAARQGRLHVELYTSDYGPPGPEHPIKDVDGERMDEP